MTNSKNEFCVVNRLHVNACDTICIVNFTQRATFIPQSNNQNYIEKVITTHVQLTESLSHSLNGVHK